MVGGILINLVIVVCCFWVFLDAANNHIGSTGFIIVFLIVCAVMIYSFKDILFI